MAGSGRAKLLEAKTPAPDAERSRPRTPQDHLRGQCQFTSNSLDQWAYAHGVQIDFSRARKPTDNALIESFKGWFRAECVKESWFLSLEDAEEKIDARRTDYHERRTT